MDAAESVMPPHGLAVRVLLPLFASHWVDLDFVQAQEADVVIRLACPESFVVLAVHAELCGLGALPLGEYLVPER